VRDAFPTFVTVTVCGGLVWFRAWPPKLRVTGGESETCGPDGTTPVPLSDTAWGEPAALSAIVRVADEGPTTVGVKVTVMVHVPPDASPEPQVLAWVNGVPDVILMPLIARDAPPE
jgi:hypothetical protein